MDKFGEYLNDLACAAFDVLDTMDRWRENVKAANLPKEDREKLEKIICNMAAMAQCGHFYTVISADLLSDEVKEILRIMGINIQCVSDIFYQLHW